MNNFTSQILVYLEAYVSHEKIQISKGLILLQQGWVVNSTLVFTSVNYLNYRPGNYKWAKTYFEGKIVHSLQGSLINKVILSQKGNKLITWQLFKQKAVIN